MAFSVRGLPGLQRRLRAMQKIGGRPMLQAIQLDAVRYAKQDVPRKTGHLGRSIAPGGLTPAYAIVHARARYAAYVELGTRPHVIRPRHGKVLRFAAPGAATRLSGAPTRGTVRSGALVFARKVNHPGTKPQPFLVPAAKRSVEEHTGRDVIIKRWNEAA